MRTKGPTTANKRLRHHCAACGALFVEPKTYAYCSKTCEHKRGGMDRSQSGAEDAWLVPLIAERIRLERMKGNAVPWDRDEIQRRIDETHAREAAARRELRA